MSVRSVGLLMLLALQVGALTGLKSMSDVCDSLDMQSLTEDPKSLSKYLLNDLSRNIIVQGFGRLFTERPNFKSKFPETVAYIANILTIGKKAVHFSPLLPSMQGLLLLSLIVT